jgi:hypothetical protein
MTAKMPRFLSLLAMIGLWASPNGGRAEYIGGTIADIPGGCPGVIQAIDEQYFVFYSRRASWRVPYEHINLLEYGQKVDRRYVAAAILSPLFLMAKKREHFLTIGYEDERGRQQAMIFRVGKADIRSMLVCLEARTGRKVDYQDDEARKAGKG